MEEGREEMEGGREEMEEGREEMEGGREEMEEGREEMEGGREEMEEGREEMEEGREGYCSRGIHMGSEPRLNILYVWPASWLAGRGDEPRVQGFRRCHPFFIVAYIWAQPAELPW